MWLSIECLQRHLGSLVPDEFAIYSNETQWQPGWRHDINIGRSTGISEKSVLCSPNLNQNKILRYINLYFFIKFTYVDRDIYVVVQLKCSPYPEDLPMKRIIDYEDAK